MEIKFKLTKTDYNTFIKAHLVKYFVDHIYYLIIAPIILAWVLSPKPVILIEFVLIWICSTALINLLSIVYPFIRFKNDLKKMATEDADLYGDKMVSITENGLGIGTVEKTNNRNWESIKSVTINDKFIYIIFLPDRFLVIPIKAFQSDSEISNFLGIINSYRKQHSTINLSDTQILKPPYYMGLLCLIPLVGAVVGLYLALTGIFKYKNNWLTIIGLVGVIFSLSIVYYVKKDSIKQFKDEKYKKGLIHISQNQLNILVKDIEFYKLINGGYPNDLSQLQTFNKSVIIQDFISHKKRGIQFNYKKIGDRYSLTSSGLDGIPDTNDDIYPSIIRKDSTKIGLINK